MTQDPSASRRVLRRLAWTFAPALAVVTPALAADYPVFRQGLWEFNRTIEPQGTAALPKAVSTRRCIDPTADMKRQNTMLAKQGCTLSPLTAQGKVFTFTAECRLQGAAIRSTSVITAERDTAYTLQVTSTGSMGTTREKLVARRVGDCKP